MTLFTLLLALTWERLFKKNDRWQIDTHLEMIFRRLSAPSLLQTLCWGWSQLLRCCGWRRGYYLGW